MEGEEEVFVGFTDPPANIYGRPGIESVRVADDMGPVARQTVSHHRMGWETFHSLVSAEGSLP
jgi:hypothetical protein